MKAACGSWAVNVLSHRQFLIKQYASAQLYPASTKIKQIYSVMCYLLYMIFQDFTKNMFYTYLSQFCSVAYKVYVTAASFHHITNCKWLHKKKRFILRF